MRLRALLVGLLLLNGCQRSGGDPDPLALVPATDLNPDPNIVEIELVAALGQVAYLDGKKADVWGYRDAAIDGPVRVPGPLIEAKVGDLLIVRVKNELAESTTVHWHGLRLPHVMDGTNLGQLPIMPGESFEYRIPVRDAGTFWYHPHMRADVQIENGLYAPLVVHGTETLPISADRYFVLDDVKLASDGKLSSQIGALDMMVGRQGNVLLVNGAQNATLKATAGSRERWRFVNAANGRFFNLELPGHAFRVIAWDGGLIEAPYLTNTLLIAPGERYDVLVELQSANATVPLRTLYYDRGHNLPDPGPLDLMQVKLAGRSPALEPLPAVWRDIDPLVVTGATVVRRFVLTELEDPAGGPPSFFINDERWPFNTPISAIHGETEIWEIENLAEMDHPFHLHGMFFQVLDVDGVPETRLGWKDTFIVPQLSTARFAVTYEMGMWMYHCHILEHAELGMMGSVFVTMP